MIKIAIVEDDPVYRDQFTAYLQTYQKEQQEELEVDVYEDGADLIDHYKKGYDILLLDIEMPFTNGMTAAEKVRKVDQGVVIIFITNMAQYALRGYKVDATDYVLKPVNYFAFSERIDKAVQLIRKRQAEYLVLVIDGTAHRIPIDDLYYVEIFNHQLVYHTAKGEVRHKGSLKEVAEKLPDRLFYLCSNNTLINLGQVEEVREYLAVVHGEEIQVSRARKKGLLQALSRYLSEEL